MTNHVVRIPLTGTPSHWFRSTADADGQGYTADISVQRDDGECLHSLSVRQGQPLEAIFWTLDICNGGAWASAELPGFGITEKDLGIVYLTNPPSFGRISTSNKEILTNAERHSKPRRHSNADRQ